MGLGWLISGGLHAILLAVLLFGAHWFERDREDLRQVATVSLIDAAEFDAPRDQAPEQAPDIALPELDPLVAPEAAEDAGETPDQEVAPVATTADFVEDPSAADAQADLSALIEALVQPEVATEVDAPDEAEPATPELAMPGLTGMDQVNQAPRAPSLDRPFSPLQAPRIAGTESPKPPTPDKPAEVAQDATVPSQDEAADTAEAQDPTVQEESTTAASPEAPSGEEDGIALRRSSAPRVRPRDFEQQVIETELAEAERQREEEERRVQEELEAAVAAAVAAEERQQQEEIERLAAEQAAREEREAAEAAERQRQQQAADAAIGPPLTAGEKDGLRLAVQRCWNIPAGLRGASDLRVVVGVDLDPDGRVVGRVTLLEPAGSDRTEIRVAFEAARRAILRCQGSGYDLPREKYEQWKRLEVAFNPEGMLARW